MRENEAVLHKLNEAIQAGKKGALATVVKVKGSAYRREGAKMFIDDTGHYIGLISGGCLEADVAEVAQGVIRDNKAILKRYELDEDLVWGLGLGCPGTVEIFIEPIAGQEKLHPPFSVWSEAIQKGEAAALCTVIAMNKTACESATKRLVVTEKGHVTGSLGNTGLNRYVEKWANELFHKQNPRSSSQSVVLEDGTSLSLFLDVVVPLPTVFVFGAGHDAIPVARLSATLGFPTTVVDPRPGYNTAERFPLATRLLIDSEKYAEQLAVGKRSYVVIMNHHMERDQEALKFALLSEAAYVGLLGPRSRRERIMEALEKAGSTFTARQLARLCNPIGLDIGADNAEEIAVSILAEIIAKRTGHEGGLLRDKAQIHQNTVIAG
ncbi:xanthine dehydrogenase [Brevibacillus reuszeri]|uniref:XdhC family protein n=1 Tax=Brevibacillus reuszeri TaxID=54915 RepID=UPI001B239F80|nr:XdhC/CoxI family protein [Brevibacillus reuszeri]GIO08929.1 xanthine dehydrogenase [Brevibacillus reuszeri]